MEVRICPDCGTENRKSQASCINCHASLATVPVTRSGAGADPAAPQGRTLSGTPMQGGRTQSSGSPLGVQPRPQTPYSSAKPASGGSMAWLFILVGVLVVILGAAYVGLKMRPMMQEAIVEPKVPAAEVVKSFLEAKRTKDINKVKPFLSEKSITKMETAYSGKQMESAGFTAEDAYNDYLWNIAPTPRQLNIIEYKVKPIANAEAAAKRMRVVRVNLEPTQAARNSQDVGDQVRLSTLPPEVDLYLVIEDAQWKVDMGETISHAADKPLAMPK